MSPRRLGQIATLALVAALLALAAGCGSREPFRVGVLTDCTGVFGAAKVGVLAGATLPLVERGAKTGGAPGELQDARVAGRAVELVSSCTEFTFFSELIAATRSLVEDAKVDVVVGPIGVTEGPILKAIAERYPDVTFVLGTSLAQEATLRDSQPNVFRFGPDGAQYVAGLGTHAFEELGWRRAVVVAENYAEGWEHAAGFVAEFCALGGVVVERDFTSVWTLDPADATDPRAAAIRHARTADGVALFLTFMPSSVYLDPYAAAVGTSGLARRLVVAGSAFHFDPANLAPPNIDTSGVVVGGVVPLGSDHRSMAAYRASFRQAFPDQPPDSAGGPLTITYYTAMEAIASALEMTGGEPGDGQADLRRAFAEVTVEAPQGPVRLDDNRQAISETVLERITRTGDGQAELDTVRTIAGVTQSYGGLFTSQTASPSRVTPACTKGTPPPWAT
jgi:branched-chain amino acid transport system substrate-binding protein